MIDKRAIRRYHKRVDARLAARGKRFDGNRWEEDKHPRAKDGKFASGSGSSGTSSKEEKNPAKAVSGTAVKPRGATPKLEKLESSQDFYDQFHKNRDDIEVERRWRVSADYKPSQYDDMQKYVNKNGSTFALHGTDIVSVAANRAAGDRGADILADAVAAGGNKLDAYAGIYGFYQKCGFEPVSWTEWDDNYANEDWLKANGYTPEEWKALDEKPSDDDLRVPREPIVFFKYTGKVSTISLEDFTKSVEPKEYEDAAAERDKQL